MFRSYRPTERKMSIDVSPKTSVSDIDARAYHRVECDENGRVGYHHYRAESPAEAMSIARETLAGTGIEPTGAELAYHDIRNWLSGSRSKSYRGVVFFDHTTNVYVAGENHICRELAPRLDLRNHSPTGFAWGYLGSGPAQLSLAILADFLGDDDHALALYQPFKEAFVARWNQDKEWCLTESVLRTAVDVVARGPHGPYRP
jgi:hypothetical protein